MMLNIDIEIHCKCRYLYVAELVIICDVLDHIGEI